MALFALSWILASTVIIGCAESTRHEHKVHNIVLFPEKHAWCNLTKIRQVLSHPGCESVEIDNSVCVGACFSYTVPQTSPPTPGDDLLHYCDSCQQADFEWRVVALDCKDGKNPTKMLKHVQIINNCTCAKCQETPAVARERLSKEVDALEASKTPEFISNSVSSNRVKVPDGVRQELLRQHGDEIRGLNSQFGYDHAGGVDPEIARHRASSILAKDGVSRRVHRLHAVEGDGDEDEDDYDYADDGVDGSHHQHRASPAAKSSGGSSSRRGMSHHVRLHPDDLPDVIQSALTGPDLHLTRGLEHTIPAEDDEDDDDDSMSNHVDDDDADSGYERRMATSSSPPTMSSGGQPPSQTSAPSSSPAPPSSTPMMMMATTTTAASSPAFPDIKVPPSLHAKPDFTSNAVDAGDDDHHHGNAVPSDDGL